MADLTDLEAEIAHRRNEESRALDVVSEFFGDEIARGTLADVMRKLCTTLRDVRARSGMYGPFAASCEMTPCPKCGSNYHECAKSKAVA